MKSKVSKAYHQLLHWKDFRLRLFIEGIIIGALAGTTVITFRVLIEAADTMREKLYQYMLLDKRLIGMWFAGLIVIALLLSIILKWEPLSSGSGIPQVKGAIQNSIKLKWPKILLSKFVGGVLAIGSGLSLGREGPSIQLGAVIGQGLSRLLGRTRMEERFLLTSGASAGLAAAFNAPLAGVMFALEELHKNFSPAVLMAAMAASITADIIARVVFGQDPVFNFEGLPILPLEYYGYLVLLGIITGLLGIIFNKALLATLEIFEHLRNIPIVVKIAFPILIGGVAGFYLPEILGGGNGLIGQIGLSNFTISMLLLLLIAKCSFTLISYGSGVPGGIFLPTLVIGALIGGLFSNLATQFVSVSPIYTANFVVLAMAAFFSAIVKAPITGSILITEMTGSFNHLFAFTAISITAYLVADIFKSEPIYDKLLERSLRKRDMINYTESTNKQVVTELSVYVGSGLDGKKVKDVEWPEHCLLVSVKRGASEIMPKGNTKIIAGDFVYVLINEDQLAVLRILAGECLEVSR